MNQGVSQNGRFQKALEGNYFSVDERSMLDLLQFTIQYAEKVRYFDFNDKTSNTWKPFFMNDPLFIIALISGTDLQPFKKTHDSLMVQLIETDESQKIEIEKKLAFNILKLARYLITWQKLFVEAKYEGSILKEIKNSIGYVRSDLGKILSIHKTDSTKDQRKYSVEDFGLDKEKSKEKKEDILLSEGFKSVYKSMLFIKRLAADRFEAELFERKNHQPHIGLMIAFFKLFEEIQKDANEFTQRHLDFYYKKLLEQKPEKQEPHTASLGINGIGLPIKRNYISQGQLVRITFENKRAIDFETIYNEYISESKIGELRILFKNEYSPYLKGRSEEGEFVNILYDGVIYSEKPTQLVDFQLNQSEKLPTTLGEDQSKISKSNRTLWESEVGIAVSSPVLIVEKGNIGVKIAISFLKSSFLSIETDLRKFFRSEEDNKTSSENLVTAFLRDSLKLFYSTKEGWKEISNFPNPLNLKLKGHKLENTQKKIDQPLDKEEKGIEIEFRLTKSDPIPWEFNNQIHGGDYDTVWPVIKIVMNNEATLPPYRFLKLLQIVSIGIEVDVKDVEKFQISNQLGDLDLGVPFQPFGPLPSVGSKFKISNPLILSKFLSELKLKFKWSGLPLYPIYKDGFPSYYNAYPQEFDNQSFKVRVSLQSGKELVKEGNSLNEFNLFHTNKEGESLVCDQSMEIDLNNFDVHKGLGLTAEERERNEFAVILTLTNPPHAFGHKVYTELFSTVATTNAGLKKNKKEFPKEPYTPVLEHLLVDYKNYTKENLSHKNLENSTSIKLFQIYPFGHVQVYPELFGTIPLLIPEEEFKGNIFIGLVDVRPNEMINLGFELEPAVYPISSIHSPDIVYDYLDYNKWESMTDLIFEDSTLGFDKSGIIKIKIPGSLSLNNTLLPSGKFWLRFAYKGQTDLNSKIKKIYINAVRIKEVGNSEPIFLLPDKEVKINKIELLGGNQKFNVFGIYDWNMVSKLKKPEDYYVRTSEILRHKNRASTSWDFERLVLDKFPEVESVFVYGRSSFPGKILKGTYLQVVVVSKPDPEIGYFNRMIPYWTLVEIKEYLATKVSAYAKFEVSNPVFEKLKIRCKVRFKEVNQSGYFKTILNRDLIMFLSSSSTYNRNNKDNMLSITMSEIINFIENRNYVEFVTGLSVLQIIKVRGSETDKYNFIDTADEIEKTDSLINSSPYAVLTSAEEHYIEPIKEPIFEGKIISPEKSTVGKLTISSDFIIKK